MYRVFDRLVQLDLESGDERREVGLIGFVCAAFTVIHINLIQIRRTTRDRLKRFSIELGDSPCPLIPEQNRSTIK